MYATLVKWMAGGRGGRSSRMMFLGVGRGGVGDWGVDGGVQTHEHWNGEGGLGGISAWRCFGTLADA